MAHFTLRGLSVGLVMVPLLALIARNVAADEPKAPAKGGVGKHADDPLQAIREAFAKGISKAPVEPKDLPKEISDGAAKARPGASIKGAERIEIKQTMKYVAADKPQVQTYQADLVKDGKRTLVLVAPDGKKLSARPLGGEPEQAKKADAPKEIDIPEKAAKAVKAIKEVYPDAVVIEITTEVYQDPTGTVEVLTYEVEFLLKGVKREMVASPEGVIPSLWKPLAEKDLPEAVAATLAKEGGKVESAARFEVRAGLQFAPADKPRVMYQLQMEKDGAASTLQLRADGSVVPPPVRPGPQNSTYLGVALEKGGTTVSQVMKDSPAELAGIKAGDKFLMIGDEKVAAAADLLKVLRSSKPGAEVKLQLQRGEQTLTVSVKLAAPAAP